MEVPSLGLTDPGADMDALVKERLGGSLPAGTLSKEPQDELDVLRRSVAKLEKLVGSRHLIRADLTLLPDVAMLSTLRTLRRGLAVLERVK